MLIRKPPENRKLYTLDELEKIVEWSVNNLKGGAENKVIRRADNHNLGTYYEGVTRDGILKYRTTSATTPGVDYWEQEIKLLDFEDALEMADDMELSDENLVNLMVFGDIAIHCSCPAFLYWGYKYISWELDYGKEPENRAPDIRNPGRSGTVCKHLYNVFTVIPAHILRIASDLRDMDLL